MSAEEETIAIRAGENFDLEKVEQYLRDHIEDIGAGSLQVQSCHLRSKLKAWHMR